MARPTHLRWLQLYNATPLKRGQATVAPALLEEQKAIEASEHAANGAVVGWIRAEGKEYGVLVAVGRWEGGKESTELGEKNLTVC